MKKLLSVVLLLSLLLLISGCNNSDVSIQIPSASVIETTTAAESLPFSESADFSTDPVQIYQTAANAINSLSKVKINAKVEKQVLVDAQVFVENIDCFLSYQDLGLDTFAARVESYVDFDDVHTVYVDETFYEGQLYGTIGSFRYTGELTQDDFYNRYVPTILLAPEAYASVTLEDNIISFQDATRLESWVNREGFQFVAASGTAILDDQMQLTGFTYSASYFYGNVRYDLSYATEFVDFEASVSKPSVYVKWNDIPLLDAPLMLERAYGYLLASDSNSINSSKVVQSAAVDFSGGEQNELLFYRGEDLLFSDLHLIEVLNLSNGELGGYWYSQDYAEGVLTYSEDGEILEQTNLDQQEINDAYVRMVDYYYPDLWYVDELYVSFVQGGIVLDYSFNSSYSEVLRQDAQYFLFGEPQYLDLQSSGYELLLAEGYIALDIYSGLPTSVSATYSATQTINGEKYPLTFQVTQNINAVDRSVFSRITGEDLPTDETTEQPTPLFYHVSGENGEEMWMLGTIHLGDARTSNLPQEIYDAFAASDALAVEFDLNDFAEQLAKDPALSESVMKEYFYLDGTTIEEHLQIPDLYIAAIQTMKLTGQFQEMMIYTKPVMWSQIIEEFYLRQGYILSAEDGVDMQFLELAEEQEKTILNVESGLEQLKMLTGFSDEVQEMILASTLSIDPVSFNAQQMELYEYWCQGDEDKIISLLMSDTADMSQEELELYEEYTMAMDTERNEQMLQVAQGYLESGETIFFAVGLAHLLVEDGLVNTLQNAGYTVELVTYS